MHRENPASAQPAWLHSMGSGGAAVGWDLGTELLPLRDRQALLKGCQAELLWDHLHSASPMLSRFGVNLVVAKQCVFN